MPTTSLIFLSLAWTHSLHVATMCYARTRDVYTWITAIYFSGFLLMHADVQPVSNLQAFGASKRGVSYTFTASPTSGASYKVTFIPQRAGIPQPPTETFSSAGLRTKSRLVPDVMYIIQVVAVMGGVESTAVTTNFTTLPDGELQQLYWH